MTLSDSVYARAAHVLPGGVTAAARVNAALGRPLYVSRSEGPLIFDIDGNRLVDMCMSNGATLLGHSHPAVAAAIKQAVDLGMSCAYDGEPQIRLAERLVTQIPCFEQVRFTNSGTEATWYAVRVARTYTGRTRVVKFEGHFHGFNDPLAFSFWPSADDAGPPDAPLPHAETAGLPPAAVSEILVLPFNDTAAFVQMLDRVGTEVAAVIMEPINYDSGAIVPDRAFLDLVRRETARCGIVLIFDEILSGYRTGPDGAQGYLGVLPDLCTLGKAIGGGVPLSVFGGKRELMDAISPVGPAVHTGTYNAHLIPVMAAHAVLDTLAEPGFYAQLLGLHARLFTGLQSAFDDAGLPVRVQGVGARGGLYFGLDPATEVTGYRQASRMDKGMMAAFCRQMWHRGVYVNPAWHHGISAMHTEVLVDEIIEKARESARAIAR